MQGLTLGNIVELAPNWISSCTQLGEWMKLREAGAESTLGMVGQDTYLD
jgi:hypothetical protein